MTTGILLKLPTPAIRSNNVGDNVLIEFDALSVNLLAIYNQKSPNHPQDEQVNVNLLLPKCLPVHMYCLTSSQDELKCFNF